MLKFLFYFVLSFVILSVPIHQKAVFNHIHNFSGPYTLKVIKYIGGFAKGLLSETKDFGEKLYNNSTPNTDKVIYKQSAAKPDVTLHESYTDEEEEVLKKILREAN